MHCLRHPSPALLNLKLCALLPAILTHRITTHLDTMGVVNQPVEDAVSHSRSPICSCQRVTGNYDVRISEQT